MIALSFLLGALNANAVTGLIAAGQVQLLPMLMLGVCAAELRHQMGSTAQALMGHWLMVDAVFAAFLAVTFCPYSYTTSPAEAVAEGFKDPGSVALLAMQQVLFCLLLTALSCQAFHTKRSVVVHFVLRRSLLSDVFGKYSYTFYLFALPVIFVYYPKWAATVGAKYAVGDAVGWVQWVLILLVSMAVAMVTQWWQDEYVTGVYVSLLPDLPRRTHSKTWRHRSNSKQEASNHHHIEAACLYHVHMDIFKCKCVYANAVYIRSR